MDDIFCEHTSTFKKRYVTEYLDLRCMDCMEMMKLHPDKYFDLAIVDPPYGICVTNMGLGAGFVDKSKRHKIKRKNRLSQGAGKLKDRKLQTMSSDWDANPPDEEYFSELFRVSQNQIIWGGNYFPLPPTRGIICWDKQQPWENFSQWEMAWTSFDKPAAMFRRQNSAWEPGKIHPTQKPVKLYQWLLANYAKAGDKILDTHMGSGSIAIACHYAKLHLTACEIDEDYFDSACERIKRETAQQSLDLTVNS